MLILSKSGETIGLVCQVTNESSVSATPRALLLQIQIYMCGETHRGFQSILTEPVVGKPVASESTETQVLSIAIPSDVILSVKTDTISLKYTVHVTLDIPHAFDIHVNLPFVVTTDAALKA